MTTLISRLEQAEAGSRELDVESEFMEAAWAGFIQWAVQEPQVLAQYKAETGRTLLPPAKSPLEAAIDHATGADADSMEAFVFWATEQMWGLDEAPPKVRDAILARTEGRAA